MRCRHCKALLNHIFIDLNSSPPSNAFLSKAELKDTETCYPLKVMVCEKCWLVQTEDFIGADEMFSDDYAYFSSFSASWLKHAEKYVDNIINRFSITSKNKVAEIAANDGYLLQYFQNKKIPCYGIEPTKSTAAAARDKGLEIIEDFFGVEKAKELLKNGKQADLTIANNVLAHVPDINDFVSGFSILLKEHGVATFEFPHLLNLVEQNQFDTIYHEHYSYLSLIAVQRIFKKNGLAIFDVENLPTHGGSLRVYAQRDNTGQHPTSTHVYDLQEKEKKAGLDTIEFYSGFQHKAETVKNDLLAFLKEAKEEKLTVAAYGAAAKGNTLLNFAGINSEFISFVVDLNPAKQNKYMPGSRIPIVDEAFLKSNKPDRLIILPWNLKSEIIQQLHYIQDWESQFVVAIPKLEII
jgi:SAM-dependent methyltransferase